MSIDTKKIVKGVQILKETDLTTSIEIVPAGSTNTKTTIQSSQTTNKTLTLPDANDTLLGATATQGVSNKTFDNTNIFTGVTIGGSAINATPIGATTPSTGNFTSLAATSATVNGVTVTTNTATQTLTNKSLSDSTTSIVDATDATKQIKFDAAGTTATATTILSSQTTNKTLTLPDITDTLVTKNTIDILTNKTLIDNSTIIADNTDNTKQIKFDASGTTGTSTTVLSSQTTNKTLTLPDATDTLVARQTAETLLNKTLASESTIIQSAAGTKQLKLNTLFSSSSTLTSLNTQSTANRNINLPDASTNLVGDDTTQTLTNKTLLDSTTIIADNTDSTKQIKFDAAGTTGTSTTILSSQTTNKTLTLPDITDTLVTKTSTDILTNKTINTASNTITNIADTNVSASAAIALSKLATVTASRALVSDGSGVVSPSAVTSTELGYVSGVTSSIQTQINSKISNSLTTTTGDLIYASAANTPARLGIGSSNQVLTVSGGLPVWSTPATALDSSGDIQNLAFTASVAANAMTIALKTKAGTDASSTDIIKIGFRNAGINSGFYNVRTLSAALSLVVPAGATLGGNVNGTAYKYWLYAIDNAGSIELGISLVPQKDDIYSTTAITSGSTTNRIIYSTTARTNVSVRMIGSITATEATVGTWATAPSALSVGNYNQCTQDFKIQGYMGKSGSQTGVNPNNTSIVLSFDVNVSDNVGGFNQTPNRYIMPKAGWYTFTGSFTVSSTNVLNNLYSCQLVLNGSNAYNGSGVYQGVTTQLVLNATWRIQCTAPGTDYVELRLYGQGNNSASTLTVSGTALQVQYEGTHL